MADRSKKPETMWRIPTLIRKGYWYDWADPETGRFGQCYMSDDGTWKQSPLGATPVVLEYLG